MTTSTYSTAGVSSEWDTYSTAAVLSSEWEQEVRRAISSSNYYTVKNGTTISSNYYTTTNGTPISTRWRWNPTFTDYSWGSWGAVAANRDLADALCYWFGKPEKPCELEVSDELEEFLNEL